MLHIVLLILKILGIILAIILGIVLFLLGIGLFVPIRYRIDSDLERKDIGIRFHWFFHLLSGYANYKENKFSWKIRLGWKLWKGQEEESDIENETHMVSKSEDKTETKTQQKQKKTKAKKKEKRKKKYTFQKICDKIKAIIEKKTQLQEFIQDTKHRQSLSIVKNEVFRLWRVLRPRTVETKIHFGFEDPYLTGIVLAVLSMLYPWYGDSMEIRPDFEDRVFEGTLYMKGRLHLIWAVVIIYKLYFNENVMNSYRVLKELGGKS